MLVTGACGVLGGKFCELLAETDDLFLTGRSEERLLKLKEKIVSLGFSGDVLTFAADLNSEEDRAALFSFADENGVKFGGVINVAGADIRKEFVKYTPEKVVFQTRINFEAAVAVTHGAILRRAEKIKILAVSSMCAVMPMPYFALYSATKAALINFFTALRYEIKDAKITVLIAGSIPTRADVREDIKSQGITGRLSAKPPEYVAAKALKALNKGKRKIIVGFYNKFNYYFQKILPTAIKCGVMGNRWKKRPKDGF